MDNKVRLIDAELLTTNIAQIAKVCAKSDKQKALVGRILFMIEHMPTIEVEPVRQGKWLINCDGYYPYCSNCKNEPQGREMTLYCPNCGARMDGDSE